MFRHRHYFFIFLTRMSFAHHLSHYLGLVEYLFFSFIKREAACEGGLSLFLYSVKQICLVL
nr:MAG TPA: hypothetical protein [Caudoviricetes sp.]